MHVCDEYIPIHISKIIRKTTWVLKYFLQMFLMRLLKNEVNRCTRMQIQSKWYGLRTQMFSKHPGYFKCDHQEGDII